MDLVKFEMTAAFIGARTSLTWREVLFGLENELLAPRAVVAVAVDRLAAEPAPLPALVELAGRGAWEWSRDLVEQLAATEPERAPGSVRAKWLYLVLSWVFEHRQMFSDPLQTVEEVYADFDYPEEMAPFVRYMPGTAPDSGSKEANESRLYERWKSYLGEMGKAYGNETQPTQREPTDGAGRAEHREPTDVGR